MENLHYTGFESSAQIVPRNLTHKGLLSSVSTGYTRILETILKMPENILQCFKEFSLPDVS